MDERGITVIMTQLSTAENFKVAFKLEKLLVATNAPFNLRSLTRC